MKTQTLIEQLGIENRAWEPDYRKITELLSEEELEYLKGWSEYFDSFADNYDTIKSSADDLIELINEFADNYEHSIRTPKYLDYHEMARDAKEIEEAQDQLSDLIKNTDNLYVGFDMECLLGNWEPEEFAQRVKEENTELGDKLLNDHQLCDLALQYVEHSMINYPDDYMLSELCSKLVDCGLDTEELLGC